MVVLDQGPTGGWCQGWWDSVPWQGGVPRTGSPLLSPEGSLTGHPVGSCLTGWSLPWCGVSQLLHTCTHTCVHTHCTCMCRHGHRHPPPVIPVIPVHPAPRLGTTDPTPVGCEARENLTLLTLWPCLPVPPPQGDQPDQPPAATLLSGHPEFMLSFTELN